MKRVVHLKTFLMNIKNRVVFVNKFFFSGANANAKIEKSR